MARLVEEFNPWPAFVDLFASIIMVVLMFLLVLIVNIAFFSQFKYKISYTGSVPVETLITEENQQIKKMEQQQTYESQTKTKEKQLLDSTDKVITSGVDLTTADHEFTRQENLINSDSMVIKFFNNEIIVDPVGIKQLDTFIVQAKEKFPNNKVEIFISEPKNQISSTVAKQIGLSRAINVRNLVRKQNYKNKDVVVHLRKEIPNIYKIEHDPGFVVISIMKNEK